MIKVGITGQTGFIGTHLYNALGLLSEKYSRVPFNDEFFQHDELLNEFVNKCDVIIHLAALNRHNEPEVIYETNMRLVKQLIKACETTNSNPHVLFSSSTQEEGENLYGKSKREGRRLFEQWAERNHAKFTGFVIPNVYGPFGNPYYNSVVATFCHQLTHNEIPNIEIDGEIKLIYVGELVDEFISQITHYTLTGNAEPITIRVAHTSTIKVSHLLSKLEEFKDKYFVSGEIPSLDSPFDRNLFITFLSFINHKSFFPFVLKKNTDVRGSFVEMIKLNSGGQVSVSTTKSETTRGNHFHIRKVERFCVIKGKALIEIRKIGTDEVLSFELNGDNPSFVDMPVWFTHNIKNIGKEELYTVFWTNEHFDSSDHDTYFEKVK